jgi:hypothetical protein
MDKTPKFGNHLSGYLKGLFAIFPYYNSVLLTSYSNESFKM